MIAGSRDLSLLPLGSTTTLQLHSNWPHPSFYGAFLPAERTITAEGFDARWQVLELNRSYRQAFSEEEVNESVLDESAFGVGLYQTVDVYQRGERAVKYALLFIALTFLTFFAWEQVTRNPLHPLQYLLIGLALSIFYLLLIALSEHISFAVAYVAAAVALVAADRSVHSGRVAQLAARRRRGGCDERGVRAAIRAGVVRGLRTAARCNRAVRRARCSDARHASHRLVSTRSAS